MKTTASVIALVLSTALTGISHAEESMSMAPETTPTNTRDPHAYSNGYTLSEGPYALPGPRQLKLADEQIFWAVLGNRFEYQPDNKTALYDLQAWVGNSEDRLVLKAEGEVSSGSFEESATDILWGHAVSTYFDAQVGILLEQYREGANSQWLALGIQGLAPYWFEMDLTAYLGDQGRTAFAAELEYELLLTQKLILQPRAELTLYGKDDPENNLGSGLSNLSAGLRLRYEFSRQFAPYIGVEWSKFYGNTADLRQQHNQYLEDTQLLAGVRFWF